MVELIMLVFDDEKAHERGLIYTRRSDKFVRQSHMLMPVGHVHMGPSKFVDKRR